MRAFGVGRSRSSYSKGEVTNYHLNPYVNCIHTACGGGYENMMVLVGQVYEN